jgi:hypothetical protein
MIGTSRSPEVNALRITTQHFLVIFRRSSGEPPTSHDVIPMTGWNVVARSFGQTKTFRAPAQSLAVVPNQSRHSSFLWNDAIRVFISVHSSPFVVPHLVAAMPR